MDSLAPAGDDTEATETALSFTCFDSRLAYAEFEQRLRLYCTQTADDDAFWNRVGHDIDSLESTLDASERLKFEISVDCLLSRLGMPVWTIVKCHRSLR